MTKLLGALLGLVLAVTAPVFASAVENQTEAVKGNNAFAVGLYVQLKSQPGNLFFSPESISTALAMTYAGARGETATEMANVLHFTLPSEQLHPAMGGLLQGLNAAHDGYQLKVANALWGQAGYTFLSDFLKTTKDNYGAGFNQIDFKTAAETARQTINTWVGQHTENKIRDLIAPGVLNTETRLVLTNAIYFKGDWQAQFKKEDTKDEDFHLSSTQMVKAPLMHRTGEFNYMSGVYMAGGASFQALEIPYKNKELSMIAILPQDVNALPVLEGTLTPDKLQMWLGQLRQYPEVIVMMPKFKMETQFGLNNTLQAMGMHSAFDKKNADFSGMVSREEMLSHGEINFYVSAVIHKAFVDVNEEGTEAAAATAVVMMTKAIKVSAPTPSITFRADHPFLFVIRDNKSGSILFMGRVSDPTK